MDRNHIGTLFLRLLNQAFRAKATCNRGYFLFLPFLISIYGKTLYHWESLFRNL